MVVRRTLIGALFFLAAVTAIFFGYFEIIDGSSIGLSEEEKMKVLAKTLAREVSTAEPAAPTENQVKSSRIEFSLRGFEPYTVNDAEVKKNPQILESYHYRTVSPTAMVTVQVLRQKGAAKIEEASAVAYRLSNKNYLASEVMWGGLRALQFTKTTDGVEKSLFVLRDAVLYSAVLTGNQEKVEEGFNQLRESLRFL